jgi:hypothetical protein
MFRILNAQYEQPHDGQTAESSILPTLLGCKTPAAGYIRRAKRWLDNRRARARRARGRARPRSGRACAAPDDESAWPDRGRHGNGQDENAAGHRGAALGCGGVAVFAADVKVDVSGIAVPGSEDGPAKKRSARPRPHRPGRARDHLLRRREQGVRRVHDANRAAHPLEGRRRLRDSDAEGHPCRCPRPARQPRSACSPRLHTGRRQSASGDGADLSEVRLLRPRGAAHAARDGRGRGHDPLRVRRPDTRPHPHVAAARADGACRRR